VVDGAPAVEVVLRDGDESATGCVGGFIELFVVLGVDVPEPGRDEGGAEALEPVEELGEFDGAGLEEEAEVELPAVPLSEVAAAPGWESALESVAPVVTTTAPMTAEVAASATAALAAKCVATERAPFLGIRR
jgi:hypothetical protein